jgi:hypothetical protein
MLLQARRTAAMRLAQDGMAQNEWLRDAWNTDCDARDACAAFRP